MEWLVWILVVLALVLAWSARSKAAALQSAVDELRRDAAIAGGGTEELRKGLDGLRKLTAQIAAGQSVDPQMVRDNRLFRTTSMAKVQAEVAEGRQLHVLDVRSKEEWASGHIPGAQHIPVDQLERRLGEVPRDGRRILVTCAGGGRSLGAAEYLANRGFLNVFNVEGGMNAWRGEVERG